MTGSNDELGLAGETAEELPGTAAGGTDAKAGFLDRFLDVQQSLYAYVRSFGLSLPDADDLVQDIARALWESYASYDPARPFAGWAIGVARNHVRTRFRRQHVRRNVLVDTEVCERIADLVSPVLEEQHSAFEAQKEALEECLNELPAHSSQLMRWRYLDQVSLPDLALRIRKSYTATNTVLTRIRAALMDCVKTRLAEPAL